MACRGNGKDIILQAFHWNLVKTRGTGTIDGSDKSWYRILTDMTEEIAGLGFTMVYLPPPWRDDSNWENAGKHGGGEGYYWHDFDLDSRYGTKKELQALIAGLHAHGIKVIIDLVTNHRDSTRMKKDIWPYPGSAWAITGRDTGGTFMGGENDLNLSNQEVSGRIVQAMEELMDECGVDGWRWDFVWGYAVGDVVKWIKNTKREEYFSVGEYWQCSSTLTNDPMVKIYGPVESDRLLGWARDSGSAVFDTCLKAGIQTGVAANLKKGLNTFAKEEDRSIAVTFVDNHDMGPSPQSPANGWGQQCWPCPINFKSRAYAFVLTMPGTPCVYWPDCFDWGFKEEFKALIRARKMAGVAASSEWIDLAPQDTVGFVAQVKNLEGEPSITISIDSRYPGPGAGWTVAAKRDGEWTVWIKE